MRQGLILLLTFFICLKSYYSQDLLEFIIPEQFTTEEGLPSNETYRVFQDSKKRIWIATDYGVARYNCGKFEVFNTDNGLVDNVVLRFYEDYKGRIWFIGVSNLLCYFENEKVVKYKYNWVCEKNILPTSNPEKGFHVNKDETIFIGIEGHGIYQINKKGKISNESSKEFSIRIKDFGDEKLIYTNCNFLRHPIVTPIYLEKQANRKIIGKSNLKGRMEFDYGYKYAVFDSSVLNINTQRKIELGMKVTSANQSNDFLYISSQKGLKIYDANTHKYLKTILTDQLITSSLIDDQGGLWVTSHTQGIFYFPANSIDKLDLGTDPASNWVTSILNYNEKLFIGSKSNSWWKLEKNNLSAYKSDHPFNYFFNTPFGVARTNYNKIHINEEKEYNINYVREIISDDSTVLVAYSDVLRLSKNGSIDTLLNYITNNGSTYLISSILRIGDDIFLGGKDGLFKLFDKRTVYAFPTNGIFRSDIIKLLNHPHWGNIMLTANNGIVVFQSNGQVESITQELSNCGKRANSIAFTSNNEMILSTEKGVYLISKIGDKIHSRILVKTDHFIGKNISCLAIYKNHLFIGTHKGLYIINWKKVADKKNQIEFQSIKTNSEDKTTLNDNGEYVIGPYNSTITIDFTSLNFSAKNQYRFRLNDTQPWNEITLNEIQIVNLRDGNFNVEVQQMLFNGEWSQSKVIARLNVQVPFYKSLWFISIMLLFIAVLILITAIVYNSRRIRKLTLYNRMLLAEHSALKAQMNPHFFYNILNSIQSRIMFNENEMALEYLSRFSKMSRMMIGNSRNSFHSLAEEIEFLTQYLELENLRFKNNFTWNINKDQVEHLMNFHVPSMIIQPILENAIQHGFKNDKSDNSLLIEMTHNEENSLSVRILDNGSGYFPNKKKRKSIALTIIRERLELMSDSNHEYRIEIEPIINNGEVDGTRVFVLLPIKNAIDFEEA